MMVLVKERDIHIVYSACAYVPVTISIVSVSYGKKYRKVTQSPSNNFSADICFINQLALNPSRRNTIYSI